tara:strand:+ start:428 stop:2518 length:2091 start_codon:yes stop_codon:yes gene_type:complete
MASKAIGFLNFKFSADLTSFERAMNKAQKRLTKFGKNVTKAGQNLSRNLTLPILALGAASIKAFDEQAKAEQKLLTSLKGREDIQQRLINQAKELQKTTLFGDEATIAAQSMLAMMGLTEEEVIKLIPLIQDFATAKEMDLVTAADLVAKSMGSSTNALSRYGIEITGAVGSSERLDTAVNQLTEKFEGQAEAAALVGAGPLIMMKNQLGDLGEELGQRLMPYVQNFVDWMVKLIEKFDGLTESTKDNIVKWGLILAAIGPVLIIIGKVAIGLGSLAGAFKKVGVFLATNPWFAAAAAIAAVGYAIYDTFIATEKLTTAQDDLDSISKTAESSIMDEKVAVDLLTKELTAQGLSLEDKKIALDKLKKISPKYYGSLEIAKGKVEGLDQATKDYTASILKQAKAEAMRQKLVELNIELLEADEKMQKFLTTTSGMFGGVDLEGTKIQERSNKALKESKQNIQDRIDALSKEYNITKKISDLTSTTTPFTQKTEEAKEEVKELTKETKMYSDALEVVSTDFLFMKSSVEDQFKDMLFWTKELTKAQEAHNATMELMEDIMFSAAMSAANSQEKFFNAFLENIKKAIKQLLIQLAVLTVISLLLGGPTMTIGKAFGIAKGKVLGLEGFAEGGLVTGPTTALIGEGVGTTASNPEVVAPLDKLKSMIGGQEQNITVTGKLVGNDIFLSNAKTGFNRLRTV